MYLYYIPYTVGACENPRAARYLEVLAASDRAAVGLAHKLLSQDWRRFTIHIINIVRE